MRSQNLYFIRGVEWSVAETCFDTWTDVWVFGDVPGYQYTRSMILTAKDAKKAIKLEAIPHDSHSMRVVILPASPRPTARPRVKLLERLIRDRDRLNMELIIHGNRPGYDRLAAVFQYVIDHPGDPSDHQHVDDAPLPGRWVIPRSISLNLRHPLAIWNVESLGTYKNYVTERQDTFLPDARLTLAAPERYQPISADDCVRFSLM